MEEKNKTVKPLNQEAAAKNEVKKETTTPASGIDTAQMQQILRQAESKMQQMVENMRQMDQMLRDKTIDQLFSVLKYSVHFDVEFVEKSAKCIETYLTNIAFSAPQQEETTTEKED